MTLEKEIMEFNLKYNTADELMIALKGLTENQIRTLAFDIVWKMATGHRRLEAKRAILEAKCRPEKIRKY